MASAPSFARHEQAGRLTPVRLGVRYSADSPPHRSEDGAIGPIALAEGPLSAGGQRLGPFELGVSLDASGEAAQFDLSLVNRANTPLHVESVLVGLRWSAPEPETLRFLRHGWQSWSFCGGLPLDEAGTPDFPSGAWLRGIHHALGAPPPDRAGWHESELVSVAGDGSGAACLAGVLEQGECSGLVYWRRAGEDVRLEVELRLEVPLAPGERRGLESIVFRLGNDPVALLESYADALGQRAGARTGSSFQAGWCSWYQFFGRVSEADVLRNLEALGKARDKLPVDVVQLDDGYQRATGDWLETNERFPRGIGALAQDIRAAGFRPGIWTAPFCVVRESRLFQEHPDWLLRAGDGLHRALLHPDWSADAGVYALDPTREEVRQHLVALFQTLVEMGFDYLKLDFLYAAAMQADAADPSVTRAARLARGLDAIRAGAGEEAFLLGCGCPLGPAVGRVDGMRIGPDVAPSWSPDPAVRIPGIEPTLPSMENALRNTLVRAFMHRRLWQNDPDCLLVRRSDSELAQTEIGSFAAVVAASGGMAMLSDDVPNLGEAELRLAAETLDLARDVDAGGTPGTARTLDLLAEPMPAGIVGSTWGSALLVAGNWSAKKGPVAHPLAPLVPDPEPLPPEPLLGSRPPDPRDLAVLRAELEPHESVLVRYPRRVGLGVFCDYDGTFAVQDVGSTLAQRYASEGRPALWERLRKGELTPWQYNMELLDGLRLPEADLDAFLQTVEPDPGAHALVEWCAQHGVPFRILSDGFDRNLERLQVLHQVRFAYDANRLWYEAGAWRLAPGAPDPSCSCGTGVCKRGRIRAFRAHHPGARAVHVGNGRVSDLCASRAADLVFAKDTLAEELAAQGVDYEPFETLHDVVSRLDRLLPSFY